MASLIHVSLQIYRDLTIIYKLYYKHGTHLLALLQIRARIIYYILKYTSAYISYTVYGKRLYHGLELKYAHVINKNVSNAFLFQEKKTHSYSLIFVTNPADCRLVVVVSSRYFFFGF